MDLILTHTITADLLPGNAGTTAYLVDRASGFAFQVKRDKDNKVTQVLRQRTRRNARGVHYVIAEWVPMKPSAMRARIIAASTTA